MSSTFTNNFTVYSAENFRDLVDVSANLYLPEAKKKYHYVVLGRQLPWNDGTEVPPNPPSITDDNLNSCFKHGIYAKQLKYENTSLVVPRNNWTANTVYNDYRSDTNFYVVNSSLQVFKCLSNNNGALSTDEPELSLSTTSLEEPYFKTQDGYKWKYMYTISSQQKQRFMDNDWMPVSTNQFVAASAVPGGIDIINVTNSGNNYTDGALQDIITIAGDGVGATAKANVVSGQIQDIIIQERGVNYTNATITITDIVGGVGSGATANVSISPVLGHGFEPAYELKSNAIMFNVDFDGDENGTFPTSNDFREVFVVKNPYEFGTTNLATGNYYTLYTKIKTSPGLGDFNNDEKVFQGTTFEEANFTADVISFDEINNYLYLNNVQGTLQLNQAIKGYTSGAIRVATSSTEPTIKLYSGKVLYISDKLPVSRDLNQTDRIRFVLSF